MTYQDWLDWKNQPMTKAFYEACEQRLTDAKDVICYGSDIDFDSYNFYRGFIRAFEEMLEFKVEE